MDTKPENLLVKQACGWVLASLTWISIAIQLLISNAPLGNFFSYFTILSNSLVALSLTLANLSPSSPAGRFFGRLTVQTAIALYISAVCLVYNTVLRGLYVLQGWSLYMDNMLHLVIPVLYVLYWILFRSKGHLAWRNGLQWIIFPLLYLGYSLIRGSILHWYPYPFLNVDQIGYHQVLFNSSVMLALFFAGGLLLIWIFKLAKKRQVQ